MQGWKRIRTGWCNLFRNRVCGKERGCGSSQTSPASGHDVVPSSLSLSLSISISFSIPSLGERSSKSREINDSVSFEAPDELRSFSASSSLPPLPDVTSYISYTVLSSNLYLSTRQSGGSQPARKSLSPCSALDRPPFEPSLIHFFSFLSFFFSSPMLLYPPLSQF